MHAALCSEGPPAWLFWIPMFVRNPWPESMVKGVGSEPQIWFVIIIFTRRCSAEDGIIYQGDIFSGHFIGYTIIAIGSAKIAEDLLEKRGVNYADRPRSVMCGELSGWGKVMLLSNYNDWFRQHRKWFAQEIGSHGTVQKFHKLIEYETRRFLRCVLNDPEQTQVHVRK